MNEDFSLGKMSADARLTATFKKKKKTGHTLMKRYSLRHLIKEIYFL